MIYSRYGGVVSIEGHDTKGWIMVRRADGSIRWWERADLRADGGSQEIDAAIAASPRLASPEAVG